MHARKEQLLKNTLHGCKWTPWLAAYEMDTNTRATAHDTPSAGEARRAAPIIRCTQLHGRAPPQQRTSRTAARGSSPSWSRSLPPPDAATEALPPHSHPHHHQRRRHPHPRPLVPATADDCHSHYRSSTPSAPQRPVQTNEIHRPNTRTGLRPHEHTTRTSEGKRAKAATHGENQGRGMVTTKWGGQTRRPRHSAPRTTTPAQADASRNACTRSTTQAGDGNGMKGGKGEELELGGRSRTGDNTRPCVHGAGRCVLGATSRRQRPQPERGHIQTPDHPRGSCSAHGPAVCSLCARCFGREAGGGAKPTPPRWRDTRGPASPDLAYRARWCPCLVGGRATTARRRRARSSQGVHGSISNVWETNQEYSFHTLTAFQHAVTQHPYVQRTRWIPSD